MLAKHCSMIRQCRSDVVAKYSRRSQHDLVYLGCGLLDLFKINCLEEKTATAADLVRRLIRKLSKILDSCPKELKKFEDTRLQK